MCNGRHKQRISKSIQESCSGVLYALKKAAREADNLQNDAGPVSCRYDSVEILWASPKGSSMVLHLILPARPVLALLHFGRTYPLDSLIELQRPSGLACLAWQVEAA